MEQSCSYQRMFSSLVVNSLQLQTEMLLCLISVAASSYRYCFVISGCLLELYLHDVVKGCWLIKGQHTSYLLLQSILFVLCPLMMMMMLVMAVMIVMMMVGFDDADHFAACLHPLLSALVMLTNVVGVFSCRQNYIIRLPDAL